MQWHGRYDTCFVWSDLVFTSREGWGSNPCICPLCSAAWNAISLSSLLHSSNVQTKGPSLLCSQAEGQMRATLETSLGAPPRIQPATLWARVSRPFYTWLANTCRPPCICTTTGVHEWKPTACPQQNGQHLEMAKHRTDPNNSSHCSRLTSLAHNTVRGTGDMVLAFLPDYAMAILLKFKKKNFT